MSSRPSDRSRSLRATRALAVALTALAVTLAPVSAQASPETLRRSIGGLLQAPLDIVLSPVVAGRTLVNNLRDIDDTTAVRVAYAVPGYFWLVGMQIGAGVLRGVGAGLELLPGIFLFPLETDLDPLYDPAERGPALVDIENPLAEDDIGKWVPFVSFNVKFGITYTTSEY